MATTPRQRRSDGQRTREILLQAAIGCFADHGIDGVGIRAIASRAGTDPALVSRYFGSKEGLFGAALDKVYDEHRQGFIRIVTATPSERLGRALAEVAMSSDSSETAFRFFLRATLSPTTVALVTEHVIAPGEALLTDNLQGDDRVERARAIVSLMIGAATTLTLSTLPSIPRDRYIEILEAALQTVIDASPIDA
ncbi:TetR/AcrR family transcriptional regulator [Mycetocola zhujimingii]|uniref:HTH tetR-type domain-containing protein n=1 Tax=Mycetocola zhujimingii TaxID=2079792 RepID=A0A2U1THI2_9MICO|nr:TetR/AcrR family transcriptional regulator [Mycetocola zhujimingii]PWC08335.1 hypothetical protein DF223_03065 [Mycetocola zhujimingii]